MAARSLIWVCLHVDGPCLNWCGATSNYIPVLRPQYSSDMRVKVLFGKKIKFTEFLVESCLQLANQ